MAESAVAPEQVQEQEQAQLDTSFWKILVVDDEPAIHQVTKLALRNLSVLGRPSQLINALSARDARAQLEKHPDIAVVLLDVVMETENAGLEFIKHIRQQAANPLVRIILRTGQPGQAPERQVMLDYDINDYKEKTELTASKLFTTVMSSIRTFGHLQTMQSCERGMEALGRLNPALFAATTTQALAETLVAQLGTLQLFSGVSCWLDTDAEAPSAASGAPPGTTKLRALLRLALAEQGVVVKQVATPEQGPYYAVALPLGSSRPLVLCLATPQRLEPRARHLLDLWAHSAGAALAHWFAKA
jgi:CheY-like chemotaxis protein